MKRSEALAILSRDHHQALFVAHKLRRATVETARAERQRFLDFWLPDGRRHFRLEEELLLPAYATHGDAHHPLVLQVLGDHVAIRAQADHLAVQPLRTWSDCTSSARPCQSTCAWRIATCSRSSKRRCPPKSC